MIADMNPLRFAEVIPADIYIHQGLQEVDMHDEIWIYYFENADIVCSPKSYLRRLFRTIDIPYE